MSASAESTLSGARSAQKGKPSVRCRGAACAAASVLMGHDQVWRLGQTSTGRYVAQGCLASAAAMQPGKSLHNEVHGRSSRHTQTQSLTAVSTRIDGKRCTPVWAAHQIREEGDQGQKKSRTRSGSSPGSEYTSRLPVWVRQAMPAPWGVEKAAACTIGSASCARRSVVRSPA